MRALGSEGAMGQMAGSEHGPIRQRLVDVVVNWRVRRKSRSALLDLTDAQLRDIGVTRIDAMREANRPFWR